MAATVKTVKTDTFATDFGKIWYTKHINPFNPIGDQKFKIRKSKMADDGHLEN